MDYKTSGVDIEAGRSFVNDIKDTIKSTHRPEVLGGFGGFNGMMKIPSGYKNPVLVSGTDGVGTKLNLARMANDHHGIGIDLVAMCVNDVITSGAEPLFFLDYIACGKLDSGVLKVVVNGIADGCKLAGCSLLGGETAEMPKFYTTGKYDVAGFCVGVVEEDEYIDGRTIVEKDIIIGIESSGLHSNGYSLINDMIIRQKLFLNRTPELLTPTIIYAPIVKKLVEDKLVKGMAHITGGGLPENLPRCIPKGLNVKLNYSSWQLPEIFQKIMLSGEIPEEEMINVFNLGIGYCIVTSPNNEENIHNIIEDLGFRSWTIGEVVL
jgi:phosphoribosylformylglycinamidine cyclo-ligase